MKTLFNITSSHEDLDRFESRADLLDFMHGFDGVELMPLGEDERGVLPPERVVGLHMGYFPYWLDLWNGDMQAVLAELDSMENVDRLYGGRDRQAILNRFRRDLKEARRWGAEYVVFHVSDATIPESFRMAYRHSDEEVVGATIDLLNALMADEDGSIALLMENLWQLGLTFTRPEITRRLMEGVCYPNKGIMLDTGHLFHTNLGLRNQAEGLDYIHALLDAHGELCRYIRGVHLHQSVTGEYCRQTMMNPPPLGDTYEERYGKMFWHAFSVDKHQPFTCAGVDRLIERIAPEYLTFEFITADRRQHREYLDSQRRALGI